MCAIRVGVIGYGYWGPNLVRNFYEIPSSDVIAITDLKEEQIQRAQLKYPQIKLTQNYKDLFAMDLDAVVISTPPKTHYPIAKECLQNNLHVLVEKPMTLNSEHAEELVELADAKNLRLMVGHTFEYNSAVHALKEYIDSGELGDIYYVHAARLNLGLFQQDSNVLWDLAPHDISILLYLLDQVPTSVSTHGMSCVFDDNYDVAYVHLTFPNNVNAVIHVSWLDPTKVRKVTVVGSKKMAIYDDMDNEGKIRIFDKGVDGDPPYTNGFGEFHVAYRTGDIVIPKINYVEPLRAECEHFINCIENQSEPNSCGHSGLRVIKVLEAANNSMTNGSSKEMIQW